MLFDPRDKVVTTKKVHPCDQCGRKFPSGTKMLTTRFLATDNQGWCRWYVCDVCLAVLNEIDCNDYDETLYAGSAIETDRDYWEKRRHEIEDGDHLRGQDDAEAQGLYPITEKDGDGE